MKNLVTVPSTALKVGNRYFDDIKKFQEFIKKNTVLLYRINLFKLETLLVIKDGNFYYRNDNFEQVKNVDTSVYNWFSSKRKAINSGLKLHNIRLKNIKKYYIKDTKSIQTNIKKLKAIK